MSPAVLRDERDLLWLLIDDVTVRGADVLFTVHFLARDEPGEPPVPFVSAGPYREPLVGLQSLLDGLGHAVAGGVRALRHDPIADGLSIELKAQGESAEDGFAVVLWLDLTRMGRALKARASRGRQQAGLRMYVSRAALEAFRADLEALAG